jgi:hypothetical protein
MGMLDPGVVSAPQSCSGVLDRVVIKVFADQ